MEQNEFVTGMVELETLAWEEYGLSLAELLSQAGAGGVGPQRLARLIGVIMKTPFATPVTLDQPSPCTGALRAWNLLPQQQFEQAVAKRPWQYRMLEELRTNGDVVAELGWAPGTIYEFAQSAQGERSFFGYLALSTRKYICRDPALRQRIEADIQAASAAGHEIKVMRPEVIVASGGSALGALLVGSVPVLGIFAPAAVAGLVFLIYSIGVDAFCQWRNATAE